MKKILPFLTLIFVLLFLSCSPEEGGASLRINFSSGKTRTLSPEEEEIEIYGYTVIPIRPDGKEDKKRTSYYSYLNISSISVGKWKFKVYGFNKNKTNIAYGEVDCDITEGKNTVYIDVKTLYGNGGLDLIFTWNTSYFSNVFFSSSLESIDGSPLESTTTSINGKATLSAMNIPSGSYILKAYLKNKGGETLSAMVEAVRISNEKILKFSLVFPDKVKESEEDDDTIRSFDTTPIKGEINGIGKLMESGKEFSATFSLFDDTLDKKKIKKIWYLDGEEVGKDEILSVKEGVLKPGLHRVDLIISNYINGDLGSIKVIFKGVNSTEQGGVYESMEIKNEGEYSIGENALFSFLPNRDLVIVSNTYKTVQIVGTESNIPKIKNTYSFDTFSLEKNVAFVLAKGEENDSVFSLLFLCNIESKCKAVLTAITSREGRMTMAGCDENITERGSGVSPLTVFSSLTLIDDYFVSTCESLDKTQLSYIYFPSSLGGNTFTHGSYKVPIPTRDFGYSGITCSSSTPNGYYYILSSSETPRAFSVAISGKNTGSEYIITRDFDSYLRDFDEERFHAEYYSASSCGYLSTNGEDLYIAAEEADGKKKIFYFHLENNFIYTPHYEEELSFTDIKINNNGTFAYLLENDSHKLYTLKVAEAGDGLILKKVSSLTLGGGDYNTILLSRGGDRMIIYNRDKCKNVLLLKMSTN